MRMLRIGSLVVLAACFLAPPALGMGGDYRIDADGKFVPEQRDWPPGLVGLINSGPVFHGHWVNANSEFFFLGDTASLTRFLKRYSGLKNTPLGVVLHAGSARRSELWGDKPTERYDWKVSVLRRGRGAPEKPDNPKEKYVVTVDVWIDHDIRLGDLVVPKDVQVKSAGGIEAFVTKHQGAQPRAERKPGGGERAEPLATVSGLVIDEDRNALEGVKVQLCGMETLQHGVWKRERTFGLMRSWTTGKYGRFKFEFGGKDVRYDLWFEKSGFAPTFLYGISAKSGELIVVLRKGVIVTGTVTRLVKGVEKPVEAAEVLLLGPRTDLGYRQRSLTDHKGRYRFRASPAPEGKTWYVIFLNQGIDIKVGDKGPVPGPDFVVTVEVRKKKGVQPPPGRDK